MCRRKFWLRRSNCCLIDLNGAGLPRGGPALFLLSPPTDDDVKHQEHKDTKDHEEVLLMLRAGWIEGSWAPRRHGDTEDAQMAAWRLGNSIWMEFIRGYLRTSDIYF